MKTSCLTSRVTILCSAFLLAACSFEHGPQPAEWRPLQAAHAAREPLPDTSERIASHLAAAVLVGRRHEAEAARTALEHEEQARAARGELPSGLCDNAAELFAAAGGSDAFPDRARELLRRDDLDPALRRRLELARDSAPLVVADARLSEETRWKLGALFNRIVEPLSTMAISGAMNPIAASRSALSTLLTAHQFPIASSRERQALHTWDEWLERHPDDPRAPEIARRADGLRDQLARERVKNNLRAAEAAAEHGEWRAVAVLAHRAQSQLPDDARAAELAARADAILREREARARRSLEVRAFESESLSESQRVAWQRLARAAAAAPYAEVAARADELEATAPPPELAPVVRLASSFEPLARGDEDGFAESLARVPRPAGAPDTASRQAGALLADPIRNAWPAYRAAEAADDRGRLAWIALGQFTNGASKRDLWRPLEYLVDLPSMAMTIALFPLRVLQYPMARGHFGAGVLQAGERYVASHPDGAHADEVHATLEALYADKGQPNAALRHAEARREPDPKEIAKYRKDAAAQIVAAADKQPRLDLKVAYLSTVLREFPDTPAAADARKKFLEARRSASPQRIRLTKEFLLEHPPLWAPGALGIRSELLDGRRGNGEIADTGVTLLGRNVLEIALEGRDPVTSEVPPDDFARFVARLEEVSRSSLATDDRERAVADSARDAYFSSSRLGLVESTDPRPEARSDAVFESTHEKHGWVRSRESILPVDLVLRGDISTLGLAAFPRIRLPESTPDAMLYE
ncbi:MAG TPA: hypothetical protein VMR86_13700 [Myxococcota bacterium]|nr:hypothetical protein [Myxococcota bacterium]